MRLWLLLRADWANDTVTISIINSSMSRRDYCEEKSCGNRAQPYVVHGWYTGSRSCSFGQRTGAGGRDWHRRDSGQFW